MANFYSEALNATKLYEVYQTELERVNQYLRSEIEFVRGQLSPEDTALELGAGYGRIMKALASSVKLLDGIDISDGSVTFGREYLQDCPNCRLCVADVYEFESDTKYDAVLCLQNGLSAFKGDAEKLVDLSLNMLKTNGTAFFSSYSSKFWETRVAWFQEQADKGLLGEIDYEKTKDGNIVCKDGFTATTFSISDMERLGKASGHEYEVREVDDSSIFLIINN